MSLSCPENLKIQQSCDRISDAESPIQDLFSLRLIRISKIPKTGQYGCQLFSAGKEINRQYRVDWHEM
jgi:hypothetical protein